MNSSVLIVAGESSGEKYGAALVREYRSLDPSASFFGIGGPEMAAAGVDILHPMNNLAVVGLTEVLVHIPRIRRILKSLTGTAREKKPRAAVLIDAPDFNLRLARSLKKAGIPVLYYVSPTVWAWRRRRLKTIKARIERMLLIFPFEEEIYRKAGIPHTYVGHPLQDKIRTSRIKADFFRIHGLDPEKPLVAVLPGSRAGEVRRHLPVLWETATHLEKIRDCQCLFVRAANLEADVLTSPPGHNHAFRVLSASEDGYNAMAWSDLVLSSCGTANLETALLGTPFIAFYTISPLTYALARRMITLKSVSIVNILAGEPVVPELIQHDFTSEKLTAQATALLDSEPDRTRMKAHFDRIRKMIHVDNPSQRAARELADLLNPPR